MFHVSKMFPTMDFVRAKQNLGLKTSAAIGR